MSRVIEWVRSHPWETTAGALGVCLVVVVVLLVIALNDSEEPEAVAAATTTTTTTTTVPPDTPTTESDTEATPTTEPTVEETATGVTAVVVDNVPDVGFQIGIDSADLLVETPVEGGLTRFTAMYGSELPELVGPVRSLRPVSADLLAPFLPLVFTTGGQPFVTGSVTSAGTVIVTPEQSIAFQSLERPQPYHVFVSPGVEVAGGGEVVAPWTEGEWSGGDPATEVEVPVGEGVTWRYENDVYVRYQDGEPHQVLPTFEGDPTPLTRDTLILLVAHQKLAGYTDSADAEVPTFDVVGGGDLYVLHSGEVIEGTWFRASQADDYTFTDADGEPIAVPAGRQYLGIVPDVGEVVLGG